MLAAVQTVQTKVQAVQTKVQIVQTKSASSADKVQTKCTFVYTRKIVDYQHFKTKSAECRQNSKNIYRRFDDENKVQNTCMHAHHNLQHTKNVPLTF